MAARLNESLRRNNISLTQLARVAGVPKATLHGWTTGRSPKNLDQLQKVAQVLGVPIQVLLLGESDIERASPFDPGGALKEIFRGDVRIIIQQL